MSATGMTVRLSPENAAKLQSVAALAELNPSEILNALLCADLDDVDEFARYAAMRGEYSNKQTALRVAQRLSRLAWDAGIKCAPPLMVAEFEEGGFYLWERYDDILPTCAKE